MSSNKSYPPVVGSSPSSVVSYDWHKKEKNENKKESEEKAASLGKVRDLCEAVNRDGNGDGLCFPLVCIIVVLALTIFLWKLPLANGSGRDSVSITSVIKFNKQLISSPHSENSGDVVVTTVSPTRQPYVQQWKFWFTVHDGYTSMFANASIIGVSIQFCDIQKELWFHIASANMSFITPTGSFMEFQLDDHYPRTDTTFQFSPPTWRAQKPTLPRPPHNASSYTSPPHPITLSLSLSFDNSPRVRMCMRVLCLQDCLKSFI